MQLLCPEFGCDCPEEQLLQEVRPEFPWYCPDPASVTTTDCSGEQVSHAPLSTGSVISVEMACQSTAVDATRVPTPTLVLAGGAVVACRVARTSLVLPRWTVDATSVVTRVLILAYNENVPHQCRAHVCTTKHVAQNVCSTRRLRCAHQMGSCGKILSSNNAPNCTSMRYKRTMQ